MSLHKLVSAATDLGSDGVGLATLRTPYRQVASSCRNAPFAQSTRCLGGDSLSKRDNFLSDPIEGCKDRAADQCANTRYKDGSGVDLVERGLRGTVQVVRLKDQAAPCNKHHNSEDQRQDCPHAGTAPAVVIVCNKQDHLSRYQRRLQYRKSAPDFAGPQTIVHLGNFDSRRKRLAPTRRTPEQSICEMLAGFAVTCAILLVSALVVGVL